MVSWLLSRVDPNAFFQTVLILFLIGSSVWLKWPEIKKRISEGPMKEKNMEDTDRSLYEKIEALRGELRELKDRLDSMGDKLGNDFVRINRLERENDRIRRIAEESMEERSILMESMLANLEGLQELGANGPTKAAAKRIKDYLNDKAHRIEGGKM